MDREYPPESVLGQWREHGSNAGSWSGFASVSDEFCISDVDNIMYAGTPLSEVVFWDRDGKTGMFGKVELPAFKMNLTRVDQNGEGTNGERILIKQEL
jgi:hypothetical protein